MSKLHQVSLADRASLPIVTFHVKHEGETLFRCLAAAGTDVVSRIAERALGLAAGDYEIVMVFSRYHRENAGTLHADGISSTLSLSDAAVAVVNEAKAAPPRARRSRKTENTTQEV